MPNTKQKYPARRAPRLVSRRAFNLVEMIVTSLLIGIIAIGIVPLFTRAVSNNIYGADASQLASFLRSGAERVQQRSANNTAFNTEGVLATLYDTGAKSATEADKKLGDERWVPEKTGGDMTKPVGKFLWAQTRTVTGFSVADVFRGNIKVKDGGALVPLGDPKLFDNPNVYYGKPDITQIRMMVESMKGGRGNEKIAATPSGIKQRAIVDQYRAF